MKCYFIVALFGVSSLLIKLNIFSNFWKEDYLAFCVLSVYILIFFFFNDVVCLYLIHLLEVLCIFWVIIFFSTMRYENISPVSYFFLLYCYLLMLRSFTTIVVFLLFFFSSLESMGFWFIQFERLLFGSCIVRVGTSW